MRINYLKTIGFRKFEKEFEPWSIDIIEKGKAQLLGTESDEECQSQTKSQSED